MSRSYPDCRPQARNVIKRSLDVRNPQGAWTCVCACVWEYLSGDTHLGGVLVVVGGAKEKECKSLGCLREWGLSSQPASRRGGRIGIFSAAPLASHCRSTTSSGIPQPLPVRARNFGTLTHTSYTPHVHVLHSLPASFRALPSSLGSAGSLVVSLAFTHQIPCARNTRSPRWWW